jgi:hypothetical protein
MRHWLLLLLTIPLFGFTECSYFSPTVVPSVDTRPPIVGTRMWIDGVERIDLSTSSHTTSSGSVVVAPFVFDSEGARRLSVGEVVVVRCHNFHTSPQLGQISTIDFTPQLASQSGGVGATVSNGLFLIGSVTDLSSFVSFCDTGFTLESVNYTWLATGADFGGHSEVYQGGISWSPSSSRAAAAPPTIAPPAGISAEDLARVPTGNARPASVRTEYSRSP